MDNERRLLILGAGGFIGKELVREALRAGWRVRAVVRAPTTADELGRMGAEPIVGDARSSHSWADGLRDMPVVIDLVQLPIPQRLGIRAANRIRRYRLAVASAVTDALRRLPSDRRPLLFSVTGVDDLAPGPGNTVTHVSPPREVPVGFARIGIPVRRLIERCGLDATFVHLGTVYGPGKAFGKRVVPRIARGRMPVIGDGQNRMALVHVEDAVRALVHLAGLPREALVNRSFVVADGAGTTQAEFIGGIAALLGAARPRRIPQWIASLLAGRVLIETLCRDIAVDTSALRATGFRLNYPHFSSGMAVILARLGYACVGAPATEGAR